MPEIRSVSVHLDADVTGYIAKMRLAGAETDKAFGRSSHSIDTTNRGLATTESRLSGVESAAKSVDNTFRGVDGRLRTLDGRFAATNRTIGDTETSLGRFGSTLGRLGDNRSGLSTAAGKLDHFLGGLGAIPTLALAAGPALIPLTAAVVGLGAALVAPLTFATGGLTVFGLLGGAAIKQTQEEFKNVDTLRKSVQSARLSLEQARRSAGANASTSTSVANAQDRLTKATVAYHNALKDISPQQREFHDSLETLSSDFDKFIRGPAGQDLLGPFSKGLQIADDLLPHAAPLIHAVSGSLDELLGELDKYTQTPGFDHFIHTVSGLAGRDIKTFGHIIGDITPGLGHLFAILDKRLSPDVLHVVTGLAKGFSTWAQSKGARQDVDSFIRYLHEVGPDAAQAVEALARGAAHLVRALAPLGPPVLHVIKGIADAISAIPTDTLTELAKAGTALLVFQKLGGIKLTTALAGSGKNPLTAVAGGGGIPGAGRGVVPVYVTNPGFGVPGGPGGVPGVPGEPGVPGGGRNPGKYLGYAGYAGMAYTIATALAAPLNDAYKAALGSRLGNASSWVTSFLTRTPMRNGMTANVLPQGAVDAIAGAIKSGFSHLTPGEGPHGRPGTNPVLEGRFPQFNPSYVDHSVKALGTAFDGLHARAAQASRDLDLVGNHSHHALGSQGAAGDVEKLGGKLQSIKGGPASAAMDLVGHSAQRNFHAAGQSADQLQHKVSGLHGPKPLKVDADTSSADHKIASTDRSLTVLSQHRATPTVIADTGQAEAALRRVYADLSIIRSKTITVTTQHVTGGSVKAGNAAGGYITGPGGPTEDKIPAYLSNGEYVIRAAAVARYGTHMFHQMNAMSFANGGPVQTTTVGGRQVDPITGRVNTELHKLHGNLADVNKELQAEQQHRQNLMQAEKQLASTVASNFRSQIFGATPDGGIWGSSATSDPRRILRGDIRDARSYRRDIRRLRGRGLRGGALAEVTTLADAEQALGLPRGELRDISRLYQIRQRASQAAGARLGELRYGAKIDESNRHLAQLHKDVKHLESEVHHQTAEQKKHAKETGKAMGTAVNGTAKNARRRSRP